MYFVPDGRSVNNYYERHYVKYINVYNLRGNYNNKTRNSYPLVLFFVYGYFENIKIYIKVDWFYIFYWCPITQCQQKKCLFVSLHAYLQDWMHTGQSASLPAYFLPLCLVCILPLMSGLPGCLLACMSTCLACMPACLVYLPGLSSFLPNCSLIACLYMPIPASLPVLSACLFAGLFHCPPALHIFSPSCQHVCLHVIFPASMSVCISYFLSACLSAYHLSSQHVCLHIIFPVSMSVCLSSFLSACLFFLTVLFNKTG